MARHKEEFPPLLECGFHQQDLTLLRAACVAAFPSSSTRPVLYAGIEALLSEFTRLKIPSDAWIDGSFLTEKIEPSDVDVVFMVPYTYYQDPANTVQKVFLDDVRKDRRPEMRAKYRCDTYVVFIQTGHAGLDEWNQADWIHQFGFSEGHDYKGIVVVKTPF